MSSIFLNFFEKIVKKFWLFRPKLMGLELPAGVEIEIKL